MLFFAIFCGLVISCPYFEAANGAEEEQHESACQQPSEAANGAEEEQDESGFQQPFEAANGAEEEQHESACQQPLPPWCIQCPELCLDAGYTLGKGVGYPTGYSSVRLLAKSWLTPDSLIQPFVDLRGHILNNGKKAANVGFGARIFNSDKSMGFGANLYYDFRQGRHTNYNQIGIGAEILCQCCDFRINGYIPVGARQGTTSRLFNHYIGNYFAVCINNESSLTGFDAEIGCWLKKKNPCRCFDFNLYGAVGSYYFPTYCGPDAWGGLVRFEAFWLNCINIEVVATYDQAFHETIQGIFELRIPLGGCGGFWDGICCGICQEDMCCRYVRRREIIATDFSCLWYANFGSNRSSCCH